MLLTHFSQETSANSMGISYVLHWHTYVQNIFHRPVLIVLLLAFYVSSYEMFKNYLIIEYRQKFSFFFFWSEGKNLAYVAAKVILAT